MMLDIARGHERVLETLLYRLWKWSVALERRNLVLEKLDPAKKPHPATVGDKSRDTLRRDCQ
jgi:hypothetical protein